MPKKIKILVVDEIQENRRLLRKTLEWHGYTVEEAGNGAEALEMARKEMPGLIISDVLMPVMDGFQLCRTLKMDKELKGIPVIFYSASYYDRESQKFALALGAAAYIVKPIKSDELVRIIGDAVDKQKKPGKKPIEEKVYMKLYNERLVRKLEKKMLDLEREVAERKKVEEELKQSHERLQRYFDGTVNALASALEMRDPYTAGHQRKVSRLSCAIAEEMGISEEQIRATRIAATIHNVGKIVVPAEILSKPGRLTEHEFNMIKSHPQAGHDIIKEIDFEMPVKEIVLQHHERMDGSGYPNGLKGEEILLEARIIGVADVVEAMASHRPYRAALGIDVALEEISQNKDILYDPEVVDACLSLFTEKNFKF